MTTPFVQADYRFEAVGSLRKPLRPEETETKLRVESEDESKLPLLDLSTTQTEDDTGKAIRSNTGVIAGANFLLGNSLNLLPPALIPNLIMRYLIVSVAVAFVSSLVSMRLHQKKKTAALLRYVSLALTASTSAILWYYLFIGPLYSRLSNRDCSTN